MGLCGIVSCVAYVVTALFVTALVRTYVKAGAQAATAQFIAALRAAIPGLNAILAFVIAREAHDAVGKLMPKSGDGDDGAEKKAISERVTLPEKGVPVEELLERMRELKNKDADADHGRLFALVYTTEKDKHMQAVRKAQSMFKDKYGLTDESMDAFVTQAYNIFSHENGLNPAAFPSLRLFETETCSMIADMLNGDENVVGNLTSGGTESILMAVKTYRDMARTLRPSITDPEIVCPITIHPAFQKAGAYFNVRIVTVPVDKNMRADVSAMAKAITHNTIALAVSAPQYPHGIVDPVEAAGALAEARGLPLHVDACFGGFMLPWVEKLGYKVPVFDFRVKAVTSMSADIHKYGWGAKGASCVLFRNKSIRKHMIFAYSKWPGGLFVSPSMAGTRPGGTIAASWAALKAQGKDGFMRIARDTMTTTTKLITAIRALDDLDIVGEPNMTAFAVISTNPSVDIQAVADVMESKNWKVERQQNPTCLHFSIMPHHANAADDLVQALKDAVTAVKNHELSAEGVAAMYGMVEKMPDKGLVTDFLKNLMNDIYS
ncbi:sphingosine-1-phosphate lyase 1 [Salpingoeca rosetta]|uniref:sphinganine-1-phosphate aldolase n=1 Tax=Salpingoeca rosetta (strain ATCC 50818 / BSB-021) TaxID=946362 RepID=F2US91_SALR5|nr:sphingosine-1-phosphate lyase 1 [Salpingoeca rosetta]EGD81000.1 sphingosine-1-phosphate lyase 1 [Salpingoeca rosetta]|eukprot:XP_004987870.1 sphingosine-1-phosphate lyase 1 [Salpingoeca rosetta]